jgi:hypothetical protein
MTSGTQDRQFERIFWIKWQCHRGFLFKWSAELLPHRLANPAPATLFHNPKGIFCDLIFRSSSPVGPRLRQVWGTIGEPKDWFNYLNVSFEQSNNDNSSLKTDSLKSTNNSQSNFISCETNRHPRREINAKEFRGDFIEQLSSMKTDGVLFWPSWLAAKHLQK